MATATRTLTDAVSGTVFTSNLNSALEAMDSSHSGSSAPTDEVVNGKLWLDTSTTPGVFKLYNNGAWEAVLIDTGSAKATLDALEAKLNGIEAGATADMTATEILTAVKTVDGAGSDLDADKLDGRHASTSNTGSTIVERDSDGDIKARLYRSEYTTTNGYVNFINTQIETGTGNNYIRPSTMAQVRSGLNVADGADVTPAWVPGAVGTAGQVLTVNPGATAAEWADAAGGGGMTLIEQVSPTSDVTAVAFATSDFSAYKKLEVVFMTAGDSQPNTLFFQIYQNGSWRTMGQLALDGNEEWYFGHLHIFNANDDDGTGFRPIFGTMGYDASVGYFNKGSGNTKVASLGAEHATIVSYTSYSSQPITGIRLGVDSSNFLEGNTASRRGIFQLYGA